MFSAGVGPEICFSMPAVWIGAIPETKRTLEVVDER
jgi:hypothetical protein